MDVDEIVKELREHTYWCGSSNDASRNIHPHICDSAVDLIESLQAQLTESQRRQKAAVEDMKHIANKIEKCHYKLGDGEDEVSSLHLGRCDVCTKICHEDKPCKFEWRGPQKG